MIRFTQEEFDNTLAEFMGKPYCRGAQGPDAYDCYSLVRAVMERVGVTLPDVGKVDPDDARAVYERELAGFELLPAPRAWSLVSFHDDGLHPHIGLVLPDDNKFLHCPGRAAGKVLAEPLSRRPWRDSIDGYWWPKDYIECVVMLTPMHPTRRCWQFVRAGRTLADIIEQDVVEGRDVAVQVFLDAVEVPAEDWPKITPTWKQQLVVRPILGEGKQFAMVAGMIALSILAPGIVAALAPNMAAAASGLMAGGATALTSGTVMTYQLAQAAVLMAGGLALNSLVGSAESPREASQHYQWNPQTTQRVGAFLPLVYGTFGVRGNVICAYTESEFSTDTSVKGTTYTSAGQELINLKICYSDGPIGGVVSNSERLNGRDLSYYDGATNFLVEHFTGTDIQAASSVDDAFEIPVNLQAYYNDPVVKTFTAVRSDSVAVQVRFDQYFMHLHKDGSRDPATVGIKIELRESGGTWYTLVEDDLNGEMTHGIHIPFYCDQTYTGGSPFTITEGTSYEARVTRTTTAHTGNELFYFDCIKCGFTTAQKNPGIAYTSIRAAASKDLSGALDYYTVIQGKLVRVYDDVSETWSIQWSDNPAWIAIDILTRPVISGDGGGTAYAVDYYKRLDPTVYIEPLIAQWTALADWCDYLVDDGEGGTEKRYRFNGVFDQDGNAWEQCIRVLKSCCASPHIQGTAIGVVVDKPATPSQLFNVCNMTEGFSESWVDTSEAATVLDVDFYDEMADYAQESFPVPLAGAAEDIPATLDGFGHTKRSQVWRRAARQLRVNQYMKRTVEIPAALDAIYCSLGDVIYVQHPSLDRAVGARVVEVYSDGVKVNRAVTASGGTDNLLVRTHDGTAERLNLYTVASVSGAGSDVITISGVWAYTPNVNDIVTFGEDVKVIDLYRIRGFERTGDGRVTIQAAQYSTSYYSDDEAAPRIEAQTYSQTYGGLAPSLLPTSAEAVANARLDPTSDTDLVTFAGITFTGDAVDTVTWACASDGGVRYQGLGWAIVDDATGTTDKYIYFDPNIGDPRYLQTTSDLADLIGQERFLLCINDGGVAYLKDGRRLGKEGLYTNADAQPLSAWGENGIEDNFEDPFGDVSSRWLKIFTGDGEVSVVATGGEAGGKVLRIGDNSDNDQKWLVYNRSIPYDRDALYRMTIRARITAGTGKFYAGIIGRNAADTAYVDRNGGSTAYTQSYVAAYDQSLTSSWQTFTGYFSGVAATGGNFTYPDPTAPCPLHQDTYYFRPSFLVNYQDLAGTTEIDMVRIEKISESGEAGADVTANNAGDIIYRGSTAPSNPQTGWIWTDTSASPQVIKRWNGEGWDVLGVDLQSWRHSIDQTKLDGTHIYPSSVTTDALAANSITASKLLVSSLSAISAVLGDVVSGSLTSTTIIGALIRTAASGRYIQLDSGGMKCTVPGGSGTCGTTGNGGSNIVVGTTGAGGSNYIVGDGLLAYFYDVARGILLNVKSEQPSIGDIHLYPRTSDPTTGQPGDIALVNNTLRLCTASTPTWTTL